VNSPLSLAHRWQKCLHRFFDLLAPLLTQSRYDWRVNRSREFLRDSLNDRKVEFTCRGEPGLQDVDARTERELSVFDIVLKTNGSAGALLSITQGSIENLNLYVSFRLHDLNLVKKSSHYMTSDFSDSSCRFDFSLHLRDLAHPLQSQRGHNPAP
jgi:hypothetical protein